MMEKCVGFPFSFLSRDPQEKETTVISGVFFTTDSRT